MDYITQKKIELGCDLENITTLETRLRRILKPDDLELWVAKAFAEDHKMFLETFFFNESNYWTQNFTLWGEIMEIALHTGYSVYNKSGHPCSNSWTIKPIHYKESKQSRVNARKLFIGE